MVNIYKWIFLFFTAVKINVYYFYETDIILNTCVVHFTQTEKGCHLPFGPKKTNQSVVRTHTTKTTQQKVKQNKKKAVFPKARAGPV